MFIHIFFSIVFLTTTFYYSWCRLLTFSIFFIVGVSAATLTQLDEQGLCAELTASGLGGGVCGPPPQKGKRSWWQQHPKQLKQSNGSDDGVATPRRDVCPILCKNGLGNPLCKCKQLRDNAVRILFFLCKKGFLLYRVFLRVFYF